MNTWISHIGIRVWAFLNFDRSTAWRTIQILGFFTIGLIMLLLSGCAAVTYSPPSAEESKKIEDGEQVVVLVRIRGTLNGSPYTLYEFSGSPPALQWRHISAGIDGFRHGDFHGNPRFLDQNTSNDGWFFFLVQPGDHEFWFMSNFGLSNLQGAFAVKHAPHYRFEVPLGVEVVYIGSFHIPLYKPGKGSKWGVVDFNPYDAEFVDESSLAYDLAKKLIPRMEKFSAVLMEPREEEDMILQKPSN